MHRTASVNEYSTRYSEAIDSCAKTDSDEWRGQATNNKQGSSGRITEWPEGFEVPKYIAPELREVMLEGEPGQYLSWRENSIHEITREVYEERLKFGVAREQARKDLPLSNYTELYWKCDLRNILNFLSLRMDSHAQKEIRDFANVIGEEIIAKLFPLTWEAFNDYDPRRGAMLLTATEIKLINIVAHFELPFLMNDPGECECFYKLCEEVGWSAPPKNCRERDECVVKFKRMGLLQE